MSRSQALGVVAAIAIGAGTGGRAWSTEPQWLDTFNLAGLNGSAFALTAYDAGNGTSLAVGGSFTSAGGIPANRIAAWNGTSWTPFGVGVSSSVRALVLFDTDGAGPGAAELHAGGFFSSAGGIPANRVARWDGIAWLPLGAGTNGPVFALTVFDEDGAGPLGEGLFAGGLFTTAGGIVSNANYVAAWDGASWSPLGLGTNNVVLALATFDPDGPGPVSPGLYAGGLFTMAGDGAAAHVARWDGDWAPLAGGIDGDVFALATFDEDGAGPLPPALYAGGDFLFTGDGRANHIARWDGSSWAPVGDGTNGPVHALAAFDEDGPGPLAAALYAGGAFTMAGTATVDNLARWDGSVWTGLGSGVNATAYVIGGFDEDPADLAPALLFAGGDLTSAGGQPSEHIAAWGRVPAASDVDADCDLDLTDLAALATCLTGPVAPPVVCQIFDQDEDGDVDLADLATFLNGFTGP